MRSWELYAFLLPTLLYFAIFHYGPLYGAQIAFRDYLGPLGIWGSPWVGLQNFERFFNSAYFVNLLSNTVILSVLMLVFSFPMPVILALMLNQLGNQRYKRILQTVSYAPHFISTVVFVGMLFLFTSPSVGIINILASKIGLPRIYYMGNVAWFRPVYVLSDIWQETGWGAIIYLAALSAINPELYEAATIDGATKFQRILNIDIPAILPTVTILLVLRAGAIMSLGFEKAFLMQSSLNLDYSEIISTYVYKVGLLGAQFSFASAVGLFNSVANLTLLLIVNRVARALGGTSLW
ncbi:MAG: ABC transporter permease subunit [Spirochaetes bacterium]|nr:ABC transporter permease subunit [Spirochaetota bacterium]